MKFSNINECKLCLYGQLGIWKHYPLMIQLFLSLICMYFCIYAFLFYENCTHSSTLNLKSSVFQEWAFCNLSANCRWVAKGRKLREKRVRQKFQRKRERDGRNSERNEWLHLEWIGLEWDRALVRTQLWKKESVLLVCPYSPNLPTALSFLTPLR